MANKLIRFCKYYKGEGENPPEVRKTGMPTIWYYEKLWVEREELRDEKGFNTEEYIRSGLKDFCEDDGIPLTLKSLLFNRYMHWAGGYDHDSDIKNFKDWYQNSYIGNAEKV